MSIASVSIEKDVPVPMTRRNIQWPFANMEVGDSFFVDKGRENVARAQATTFAKAYGVKFMSRADGEGFRLWRIS